MKNLIFIGIICVLLGVVVALYLRPQAVPLGSVSQTNEYFSTTSAPSSVFGANIAADVLVRSGTGSLSTIIITGANTGILNFYDATTSNVNLRTGQIATSSLPLLASIPASTVAGTYVFDSVYRVGLLYDLNAGIMPTTTITYR